MDLELRTCDHRELGMHLPLSIAVGTTPMTSVVGDLAMGNITRCPHCRMYVLMFEGELNIISQATTYCLAAGHRVPNDATFCARCAVERTGSSPWE